MTLARYVSHWEEGEGFIRTASRAVPGERTPCGPSRNYLKPGVIKSGSSSSMAQRWQSLGIWSPQVNHRASGRQPGICSPGFSSRKSRLYILWSYTIILSQVTSAHLDWQYWWELRCFVGQHRFWTRSPYILQKGWFQARLLHTHPHTHTDMFTHVPLCACVYSLSTLVLL